MTRHDDGSSRRARRAQNAGSEIVPVVDSSRSSRRVIRKPDSTKKTSTPTNPPPNAGDAGVEQQHGQHGDGPQAFDVGAELVLGDGEQRRRTAWRRCRHVARPARRVRGLRGRPTGDHGGHAAGTVPERPSGRSWMVRPGVPACAPARGQPRSVGLDAQVGRLGLDAGALGADRRRLAVAGVHDRVVREREQRVADRAQDRRFVAVAAPGRPRPAAEQRVAGEHGAVARRRGSSSSLGSDPACAARPARGRRRRSAHRPRSCGRASRPATRRPTACGRRRAARSAHRRRRAAARRR